MYKVQEKEITFDEFKEKCMDRAIYLSGFFDGMPFQEYILFNDNSYYETGVFASKIAIREIGDHEYDRTIHIVKHMYNPEMKCLFEEDTQLNYNQIECIRYMDEIIAENKRKPKLKLIK